MSKIKTLNEYKKKYRNTKKLLSYTKADVERFQKTVTDKTVKPNYLLRGRKWVLIGDTYYQIPKTLSFTWFRNLKASVQVATWTILAGSVATAVGVPTYTAIVNSSADINQKENPHIDFNSQSFDSSIPQEAQAMIKKNMAISTKQEASGDYVCNVTTTGQAKTEFYQPTTVIEVKRGDKLFKEGDDYTVENIEGDLKVTIKSASINSTLGEIKVTPKIEKIYPKCEAFKIVIEQNIDLENSTPYSIKCVEKASGKVLENKYIIFTTDGTGIKAISEDGVVTPNEKGGSATINAKFKYNEKKATLDVCVGNYSKLNIEKIDNDYVVSAKSNIEGNVIIPEFYFEGRKKYEINKIKDGGFNETNITSIFISKYINKIECNPFVNCQKLKNIKVDDDNNYFTSDDCNLIRTKDDSNSVLVTYTDCCESAIPSNITRIQKNGISNRKEISIPSNVQTIDSFGIVSCPSISQFVFADQFTWNKVNGETTKEIGVNDSTLNISRLINSDSTFNKTSNTFVKVETVTVLGPTYVKVNETKDIDVQVKGPDGTTPTEQDVKLSLAPGSEEYAEINENNQIVGVKEGNITIIAESTDSSTPAQSQYNLRVTPEGLKISGEHQVDINGTGAIYSVENTADQIDWSIQSGASLVNELTVSENKATVVPNKSGVGTVELKATLHGTDDVTGVISISVDNYQSFIISETGELALSEEAKSGTGTLTLPKQYWDTSVNPAQLRNITTIKNEGFKGCAYSQIVIPDTIESIGTSAFEGCLSLTTFTINGTVSSIGDYAFKGCTALETFNITENNSNIVSLKGTFEGCTKLGSLDLEKFTNLETINSVVKGCKDITSITIPSNVTNIIDNSFDDNNNINTVIIDSSAIAQGHFEGSGLFSKATTIKVKDSITSMELSYIESAYQLSVNKEGSYNVYCDFTLEFTSITKNVNFMLGDEFKFTESSEPFFKCVLNDGTEQGISSGFTAKFINKDGTEHDVSPLVDPYTFATEDIGNGKIIINYKGKSLEYDIVIYDNAVTDITFSLASTATIDDTINNVTAVLSPTRVTIFNLDWTTDNESVLTVTKTGDKTAKINCIGLGTANVICTDLISGKSFSKEITIKNYVILNEIYVTNLSQITYNHGVSFNTPAQGGKLKEGQTFSIDIYGGTYFWMSPTHEPCWIYNSSGTQIGSFQSTLENHKTITTSNISIDWTKVTVRDKIKVGCQLPVVK